MQSFRLFRGCRRLATARASVGFALLAGLAVASPAQAELSICNDTQKALSIAVGYKSGDDWISEGWWNIDEGDCQTVIDGNLTNRHYYYTDFSGRIAGEGYHFCTKAEAFTVAGDADCAARGFERGDFAHLDTGTTATSFTLTINGPPELVGDLPPPGTYGEPFSVTGTNEGCDRIDGLLSCQIDVEGWLYTAYDDNRNLMSMLDTIDGLPLGTGVAISGDMVFYGDVSADVVIREIELLADVPAGPGGIDFAAADAALQGYWQSLDDPQAMIAFFAPSDMEDYYGNELMSASNYILTETCPDATPTGTLHIVATDREYSETYCYEVLTLTEGVLEMMYLPRGNILRYGPADL